MIIESTKVNAEVTRRRIDGVPHTLCLKLFNLVQYLFLMAATFSKSYNFAE